MKADGSIIIDTKILDGGMEKGFESIKDEMQSVGITAEKVGNQISLSFSKMDVSKPIANAKAKIESLEQRLSTVTAQLQEAQYADDDRAAQSLDMQRIRLYDQLEAARKKLAIEISAAAKKEADAEVREAKRASAAKQREDAKRYKAATKGVRMFGNRLASIASGALVFNLVSAGLREVTEYFGKALKSNNEFTKSVGQLKGALLTAFQPIYEFVLPALISLMRVLTAVVQVIGQFFAVLSGKSTAQMAENASALNQQANAIEGVGGAAKKAQKQLAGFDEINKLSDSEESSGGGGGSAGTIAPSFEALEITDSLKNILELVGAVGAALLTWKIASAFTNNLSTIAGLAVAVSGAVLYAFNLYDAFVNGIDWDNLSGMLLGAIALAGGLALAFGPIGAAIGLLIAGVGLVIVSLKEWITTGELSNEACVALVAGIVAIGGAIALLTGSWIPVLIAGIVAFVVAAATKADEMKAALKKVNDWLQGVFKKDWTQLFGTVLGTKLNMFAAVFSGVWTALCGVLSGVIDFIAGVFSGDWKRAWEGIVGIFEGIVNGIIAFVNGMVSAVVNGVNSVIRALNKISVSIPDWVPVLGGNTFSFNIGYLTAPQIPPLARGAVLPPNKPFLAMVGDQRHGTNVEAPLATIQEAVAVVMSDVISAMLASDEALLQELQELRATVENIQVGDSTIGEAADRYARRMALRTGGNT